MLELCATLLLAALPSSAPQSAPNVPTFSGYQPILQVRAEETRLVLGNLGVSAQWLLFGTEDQGLLHWIVLSPGEERSFPHPRGFFDDVLFEVLTRSTLGTWLESGTISLRGFSGSGDEWLHVLEDPALHAYFDAQGLRTPLVPTSSLCPTRVREATPRDLEPLHVPGIKPSDRERGDAPPKVGEKPLPAV